MALQDWLTNVQFFLRWLHVLFGIFWIGHLFFLNFVYNRIQHSAQPEVLSLTHTTLLPRILWWFRWSSMMTLLFGYLLFFLLYTYPTTGNLLDENGLTARGAWILIGITLGTILWFNVWFIVWPAQKKMIHSAKNQTAPDPALPDRIKRVSKLSTYLAGPMLFAMLAANHYAAINWLTLVIVILFAILLIRIFYQIASKV